MQKRLLLCLVITIGFMFGWTTLMEKMGYGPKPRPKTGEPAAIEEVLETDSGASAASTDPEVTVPKAEEAIEVPPEPEVEQRFDVLENDTIKITFDNKGGVIRDVALKTFYQTSKRLEQVRLVFADQFYPGKLVFDNENDDQNWMYETRVEGNRIVFEGGKGSARVTKRYILEGSFKLRCDVTYSGAPSNNFYLVVGEGLQPVGPGEKLKPSMLDMGAVNPKMMFFTWSENGDHEEDPPGKDNRGRFEPALEEESPIEWAGIKDNYFANIYLPDVPVQNIYTMVTDVYPGQKAISLPVVALRSSGEIKGSFFLGPMIEEHVAAADERLENLITFGWAGLLAKWLLAGLVLAHDITGNWGWGIVLLTLFIRLLMVPLTIPSVKSSFKMRNLQPKIEKLKQKHSGDDLEAKQALSKATFELYRKEGVNPFSSCFTALAQMPVFFAYFSLLRKSMLLRQAPWMIWIEDLSISDGTFILPILMGVTMFLSTMAMPMPSADPAQQKMMKFMPVMFSLMFVFMPAGLILYMITSNLFTLGQTRFLQWRYARHES